MRICLASWAPFHAGAEVAAERLAVGLQEQGCEVSVLLGNDGETLQRMRQANLNCTYISLSLTNKWRFWSYLRARQAVMRFLKRESPDLVHANDLPTSQMVGEAAGRLGIPRVCHHRSPFEPRGVAWLNKFGAERHLFISQALMTEMLAAAPELRRTPRALVYDGIPVPSCPTAASRSEARAELGIPQNAVVVTFAGQIVERKGVADLIRAWALLPSEVANGAILLIVGDDLSDRGAYRVAMQALATDCGVPARFVGFQANVNRWWEAADIAVVPSLAEPLGLVVLEAMAAALPVIGSAVGGIPEMIVDGETGLLVPPRNPPELARALETLLRNATLRHDLGRAGRKRCEEKFSLQAHVQAVLEQYQCVLADRAR